MFADLKFALRRLRHAPGFTIVAILTLAVAVGANTAILSIADGVLFRPLPFRDPDRVFLIQMLNKPTGQHYTRVAADYMRAIDERHAGVGEVGRFGNGPTVRVDTADGVEIVPTLGASAGYFRVLGVAPAAGRLFAEGDTPGRSAVVTYEAWQKRFGGDRTIVGRSVALGSTSFEIVGVLPRAFLFPSGFAGKPEVVALLPPLTSQSGAFHPIVRLEAGVTREQAQAEMDAVVAPLAAADPRMQGQVPFLEDIRSTIYPTGRPIMRLLIAAAVFVLLITCANLANMLLARGRRQERDSALRAALGASRLRLVRPLVFEALMIGVAASALAVLVTSLSFEALRRQVPGAALGNAPVGVDFRVALLGLGLGVAGGLVFAVMPAWRSARLDVLTLLQARHRGLGGKARLGQPMVALQVALALVLVFGAAVTTRAFVAILAEPLGFDPDRVVRILVTPPPGIKDYPTFVRSIVEPLSRRPDLVSVGATGAIPLGGMTGWSSIRRGDGKERLASVVHVTPGYFEAIGLRLASGRTLTWDDAAGAAAVVSESASRALFSGVEPIGQSIGDGTSTWQVVGVVADTAAKPSEAAPRPVYIVPVGRSGASIIVARVRDRNDRVLAELRREVGRLAPGAAVDAVWWSDAISSLTRYKNPRFQTVVLGAFAAIALSLTALGIFGVVAFLVAMRTREMGIRIAVGAEPGSLVRLVARQTLIPVAVGLVLGLIATRWAAKLAEAQLFQVQTRDPWLLALTAAIVVVAALVAAYLPARRAARVDPLVVLRAE